MMNKNSKTVSIYILDRQYDIKCPAESVAELKQSAKYLDKVMSEIHQSRGQKDKENTAIMAALTITHDLLKARQEYENTITQVNNKVNQMASKITNTIKFNGDVD